MQVCLNQGYIPDDWWAVPIFKSRSKNLSNNYRPISFTSVISKLIEHVIVSSIWQHLKCFNLISSSQHYFRRWYSTTTQLLYSIHHATQALAGSQGYHLIFFDFAKALDKVFHHLLVSKMKAYELNVGVVQCVELWVRNRNSLLLLMACLSCLLSPLEFHRNWFWAHCCFWFCKRHGSGCEGPILPTLCRWHSIRHGYYRMRGCWSSK